MAAYYRVSTGHEEQQRSLKNQMEFYTEYNTNPEVPMDGNDDEGPDEMFRFIKISDNFLDT